MGVPDLNDRLIRPIIGLLGQYTYFSSEGYYPAYIPLQKVENYMYHAALVICKYTDAYPVTAQLPLISNTATYLLNSATKVKAEDLTTTPKSHTIANIKMVSLVDGEVSTYKETGTALRAVAPEAEGQMYYDVHNTDPIFYSVRYNRIITLYPTPQFTGSKTLLIHYSGIVKEKVNITAGEWWLDEEYDNLVVLFAAAYGKLQYQHYDEARQLMAAFATGLGITKAQLTAEGIPQEMLYG